MASLNKVMLIGNLTRDPEVRYTPKGQAIATFGIAVNRQYTLDSGEKREEVTFVDVTLWARLAEIAGEYLKKGRPVYIEGRLQLDSWDDKATGAKRTKLSVIGENLQMLGSRDSGGEGDGSGGGGGDRPARSGRSYGGEGRSGGGGGGNYGGGQQGGGYEGGEYEEPRQAPSRQESSRPPQRPPAKPPKPPVDPDLDVEGDDIPF